MNKEKVSNYVYVKNLLRTQYYFRYKNNLIPSVPRLYIIVIGHMFVLSIDPGFSEVIRWLFFFSISTVLNVYTNYFLETSF